MSKFSTIYSKRLTEHLLTKEEEQKKQKKVDDNKNEEEYDVETEHIVEN